jgi:PHD/YefM family antitoxin component YafN of YafNO toxin-antitoxin module
MPALLLYSIIKNAVNAVMCSTVELYMNFHSAQKKTHLYLSATQCIAKYFTNRQSHSIIRIIKGYFITIKELDIMMNIKPSAAIRKNYNEISALCKRTKEPVFLTKNGEGDLVVMDIATFARRESLLKLKEKLLQSEADIQNARVHTVNDTVAAMRQAIAEVADGKTE